MNIALQALEERMATPVAQGGSFLTSDVPEAWEVYDGTTLTYFLVQHGGDPWQFIEFLDLNHTTGFNLKSGTRVRVPQAKPENQFPRHWQA
jgi:hypothetical protein